MNKFLYKLLVGLMFLSSFALNGQTIQKIEYFFDADPGFDMGTNVPISVGSNITDYNFSINLAGLATGLHYMYIRSKDSNGRWSATSQRVFYITPPITQTGQKTINKLEYFIDTDPGFGAGTNVPITATTNLDNFTFGIDMSSLSTGFHFLYARTQDNEGKWSIVLHRFFYHTPTLSASNNNITKLEYFIDNDPSMGLATQIPIAANSSINDHGFTIDLSNLSMGLHYMYIRSRDNNGKWSATSQRVFYITPPITQTGQKTINKLEYFIDTDPGFGAGINVPITATANLDNFTFGIDMSSLSTGFHFLYARTQDNEGKWSVVLHRFFYHTPTLSSNNNNISKLEYFIDTDPGMGLATQIPITANPSINDHGFTVDLTGLTAGFHYLYIRSKDNNGKWSVTNQRIFYINTVSVIQPNVSSLVELEYFFNTDPGIGQGKKISLNPTNQLTDFNFGIDLNNVPEGFNFVYLRAKDNNNQWSATKAQFIYYALPTQGIIPDLKLIEYYINADPGYGNGNKIMLPPNLKELKGYGFQALLANLAGTANKIYLRTQDMNGKWSATQALDILTASTSSNFAGKFGNAYSFDGLNQYAKIPNGVLNNAQTFTIEYWVKTKECNNTSNPYTRAIMIGNTSCDNRNFSMTTNNGYIGFSSAVNAAGQANFLSNNLQINDNQWHHIAAVNDGTKVKLYVDGLFQNEIASGLGLKTDYSPLTIGSGGCNNEAYYFHQGYFDEIRLSNNVRYTSNFTPSSSAYAADANTVALYHCEDDDCTVLDDASGNDNHATLTNVECSTNLCTSFATGKMMKLYENYVQVGNMGAFPQKGAISLWLKTDDRYGDRTAIASSCLTSCQNGIKIQNYGSGLRGFIGNETNNTTTNYLISSSEYNVNQWYHVVLTWNQTTNSFKGYRNGNLAFEINNCTTWPSSLHNLAIGTGYNTNSNYLWRGNIDEVSVWKKELTQTEVQGLMGTTDKNNIDLLGYWSFDNNSINGNGVQINNEAIATNGLYNGITTNGTCVAPLFVKSTIPNANSSQTITLSGSPTTCLNTPANLTVSFNGGIAPFNFTYSDGTNNYNITTNNNPHILTVSPTVTSTYTLVNASGLSCAPQLLGQSVVTISPTPKLKTTAASICLGDNVLLSTLVTDLNNLAGTYYFFNSLSDAQTFSNIINENVSPTVSRTYYVRKNNNTNACFDIQPIEVTLGSNISVNAGQDQKLCVEQQVSVALQGSFSGNVNQITWSGGNGTFNDIHLLNTSYIPTQNEINNGSVELTITTDDPIGNCQAATDKVIIYFLMPNAGLISNNQKICSGQIPSSFTSVSNASAPNFVYQWEKSTINCNNGFIEIQGANNAIYHHNIPLTQTTYFRRKIIANYNGIECIAYSNCVQVFVPQTITLTANVNTPYLCDGTSSQGSIGLNSTNGIHPLTYRYCKGLNCSNFSNAQINSMFSNLNAGKYRFQVIDSIGCANTIEATIQSINIVANDIQQVKCNGAATGQLTFLATNGTSPYYYSLNSMTLNNTGIFQGLLAGNYMVTVTDANGCSNVSEAINIFQPSLLAANATLLQYVNCTNNNSGIVNINANGGVAPYVYRMNNGNYQQSATFSNLAVGHYDFTIKDVNNCIADVSINVDNYKVHIEGDTAICNGKSTLLKAVTNSTVYNQFLWNNGATTASIVVEPTNTQNYSVTVTNSFDNCLITSNTNVVVFQKPNIAIINYIPLTCANNSTASATVSASGGQAPYNYIWSGGITNAGTVTNLAVGIYSVTATDMVGCSNTSFISVTPTSNPATITLSNINSLNNHYLLPQNGAPNQGFLFGFTYTHPQNKKLKSGYPRLLLDYEGNNNYTGIFDRTLQMIASEFDDDNTSNGKSYQTNINNLIPSTNYKAKFVIVDEDNCILEKEIDGPDVLLAPNLYIFADDITISPKNPLPNDSVSVFIKVHNGSDFPINSITTHLMNEFSKETYYDIIIPSITERSDRIIEWRIKTPNVPSFNPLHVYIDYNDTVNESNELDNHAVRSFINGDFNLPGGISANGTMNPSKFCYGSSTTNLIGNTFYYGLAVPLTDPSVAGAEVIATIIETGQQFKGFTNSSGQINLPISLPNGLGLFHVKTEVTDFTLETSFSTSFEIVGCQTVVVSGGGGGGGSGGGTVTTGGGTSCFGPNLVPTISLNAPYADYDNDGLFEYLVAQGNAVTGNLIVQNIGNTSTVLSSEAKFYSPSASITQASYNVPILNSIGTSNSALPYLHFNMLGTHQIYGIADIQHAISECDEDNIRATRLIVVPPLPDIEFMDFNIAQGSDACTPSFLNVRFNNKGMQNTGVLGIRLKIKDATNNNILATLTNQITNISFLQPKIVTFEYLFDSSKNYVFEIESDYNNVITEANESNNNNISNKKLTIGVCAANLLFDGTCEAFFSDPNNPNGANTISVGTKLYNTGKIAVINPTIRAYIIGTMNDTITWVHQGTIAAQSSIAVQTTIQRPYGNNTIQFIADPNNLINEYAENDNISKITNLCWDFNFGISSGQCDTGRYCPKSNTCRVMWYDNLLVNEPTKLYFGVVNNGGFYGTNVKVRFEVKGAGFGNGTTWLDLGNGIINLEGTCDLCPNIVELPTPIAFPQSSNYDVRFTIDPYDEYSECNESDNIHTIHFDVKNAADLFISSNKIDLEKLNPNIGDTLKWIRTTYENLGKTITDTFELKVLIDGFSVDSTKIPGEINLGSGTRQFNVNWYSLLPGVHVVRAIVDSDNKVGELREDNNEATRSFIVGEAPDLTLTKFVANKTNPIIGENIDLELHYKNQGDFDVAATLQIYYLDDSGKEIRIYSKNIFMQQNDSATLITNWIVTDPVTVLIARLESANPLESREDNNVSQIVLNSMNATVIVSPVNCNGANSGKAAAVAVGGTKPYSYLWSNGSIAKDATGFNSGTHSLTVTDNNGQFFITTFSITNEIPVDVSFSEVQEPKCYGSSDGFIRAKAFNGKPNYQYNWSTGSFLDFIEFLTIGNYSVTITDANGCKTQKNITLSQPQAINTTITNTDVICKGENTGTLSILTTGGIAPFKYSWRNFVSTNPIFNVNSGIGKVTVEDSNKCIFVSNDISINEPELLLPNMTIYNAVCQTGFGSVILNPSGGTPDSTNGYFLNWNGTIYNGLNFIINNLLPGTYHYTVKDKNNCSFSSSVLISIYTLTVSAGADITLCNGATYQLQGSSNAPNINYTWIPNTGLNNPNIANPTLMVTQTQQYILSVTDNNGCAGRDTMNVTMKPLGIANFTFDYQDRTVNFVNSSTFANTFFWEYGDGQTGTSPNPSHNYSNYGKYTVKLTITDSCGLVNSKFDTVDVIKYVSINSKVFLQGTYNYNTGKMEAYFTENGLLPLIEPYTNLGFAHLSGGGEKTTINVINNPTNKVVDWVFIELRDTTIPTVVLFTRSALLLENGDIVDVDGIKPLKFKYAEHRNYYVVIRHRNHLGFRMSNKVYLKAFPPTPLNFTNYTILLYGNLPTYPLSSTLRGMISGDANSDGSIDAFDDIIWNTNNGLFDDYQQNSDYNLDGSIDAFDNVLWSINNGKFEELD